MLVLFVLGRTLLCALQQTLTEGGVSLNLVTTKF
jgi:hypothetical protein